MHAAALMDNKRARFWYAILLENGLLPTKEIVSQAIDQGRFNFLKELDA
jgi:hypothetical protein